MTYVSIRKGLACLLATGLALSAALSCGSRAGQTEEERLRTGDLIFVGIPTDYSLEEDSMASAISEATCFDSLNIIHVAIAEVCNDTVWIIDATIRHGVDRHPLDTFLTDFTLRDGSLPEFQVMRLKDNSLAEDFVENAKTFLGEPYDMAFLPDNGAKYCSELVRDSYILPDGSHIFSSVSMNFRDSSGNMPLYWEQLFERLGMQVPEGVEGTNPAMMSGEDVLERVDVSFP